jgi:hypothetical protein
MMLWPASMVRPVSSPSVVVIAVAAMSVVMLVVTSVVHDGAGYRTLLTREVPGAIDARARRIGRSVREV